jgi:biotin-dependent carboxylase-like uncharacterized protein
MAANLLVGNDRGAACLEVSVLGPSMTFLAPTWIAVTGADLSARLDDTPLPLWQSALVGEGSALSFHGMEDGMRAYLAIAGGIDVPEVMSSRSTYVMSAIGGYQGRALIKGDIVSVHEAAGAAEFVLRRMPQGFTHPSHGDRHHLRVIAGPQDGGFTGEAMETLLGSEYTVSHEADRMGYRLDGPPLKHVAGADIVSDGNPPGAVQVPGDGLPTILLADRGTTGGYTKIATVVSADLGRLAQAVPGQTVTFSLGTVEEAHEALRQEQAVLAAISALPAETATPSPGLSVLVDGEAYEVDGEDGEQVARPRREGAMFQSQSRRVRATIEGRTFEFEVETQRED